MNYILRDKRKLMTREERKEYMKKWISEHRAEHREEYKAYMKKYNAEHREEYKKYYSEHREERHARQKKYISEDVNKNGVTKNRIRMRSRMILKKGHTKLKGYEIHHCFGYEDAEKFIYIPRDLHLKIHQFLRDNNIPAHIEHFNAIRELISSYPGYTYIHS